MDAILKFLFNFVLLFILFYIVYKVFIYKNKKDYSKLKKNDEIKVFIARYNLDMRKTNYNHVYNTIICINSFIISFSSTLVLNIEGTILKFLVCFAVVFALTYALFEIAGRYFKNKEEKKNV